MVGEGGEVGGETWDFGVTHHTSDNQSTCSAINSVQLILLTSKFMSINDHVKREEKPQEYLVNTGCKYQK